MHKHLQLQVPQPCHENWDKMTPVEKGKFCGSCSKVVTDFTKMSDQQLISFFKKTLSETVCGRFQNDQLYRNIEIPRKRIPWVKYFFQFTLPAFLISLKAASQKSEIQGKVSSVCITETKANPIQTPLIKPLENSPLAIKGRVIDRSGNGVPYSTVVIKGTNQGAVADSSGRFRLQTGRQSIITLQVSCVGFMPTEVTVNVSGDTSVEINLIEVPLETMVTMGLMISTPTKKPIPLIQQLVDTFKKDIKIYPNPVRANSTLNIEWKRMVGGEYSIELLNTSGQVMYATEKFLEERHRLAKITIPSVPPGTYFIRMKNKLTGKVHKEKILVQ